MMGYRRDVGDALMYLCIVDEIDVDYLGHIKHVEDVV